MSSAPEAKSTAAAASPSPGANQNQRRKRNKKPDNGKARSKSPRRNKNARVNQQGNKAAAAGTAVATGGTTAATAAGAISTTAKPNNQYKTRNNNRNRNKIKNSDQGKRGDGKSRATNTKPTTATPKPSPKPAPSAASAQPTNILLTKAIPLENCKLLHWKSPHPHVPLVTEETILEYLFVSSPKREGLLLRDEPNGDVRYLKIKQACRDYNMPIQAALSLRQETVHWKNKNPNLRPAGFDSKVRKSAELFEVAVEQFMLENLQGREQVGQRQRQGIDRVGEFWTEDDQREHNKKHSHPPMPTPDILFCESVCCRRYVDSEEGEEMEDGTDRMDDDSSGASNKNRKILEEGLIHWCDAKMMYGSSTIPQNNKCAVGKILKTAQKYVKWFGPGALCFMHGCGESLAAELAAIGVMALDCSSREAVNIDAVEAHQRTWCGDKNGQIVM
jgi:hypothetical protein